MAQLNSFELLNIKYSQLSQELKDAIEMDVKFLLEENKGTQIMFNESVFTHLIKDDNCASLKKIVLDEDGKTLIFHIEEDSRGLLTEFTETIEELDASACYEILLALNEKSFNIE